MDPKVAEVVAHSKCNFTDSCDFSFFLCIPFRSETTVERTLLCA